MKVILLLSTLAALVAPSPATAHRLTFHPSLAHRSLSGRAAGQRLVLRHDRRVLRATARLDRVGPSERHRLYWPLWQARLYHAAEFRWTRRELRKTLALIESRRTPWYVSKQIWAAGILGRESGGDPWPNCPDPYDGGGSWYDTVGCENGGNWLDSPGYYRCGLQFDPGWERRFGRLCP